MSKRVQVILDTAERDAFRRQARAQGLSLSAWLRAAGQERLAAARGPGITTIDELREFFNTLPNGDAGAEPDWKQHEAVINESRRSGATST